jgi:hypothetical protein
MKTLEAGNITGYAAIDEIQRIPPGGEAVGYTNSGAQHYPWGIRRFENS